MALVLDLSSSVRRYLPDLKAASDLFADSLVGTPSRMALFTFDRGSPSDGTVNYPDLTSVSTQAGADAFKNRYADWDVGSGTNWDQGLWAVARVSQRYELVVVLTDGNPTYYGNLLGNGSRTRLAEVEAGIFSANAIKAKESRVIGLGVGRGVEGLTGLSLRAISGTTAFDGANHGAADYYQTEDFAAAGAALRQLVQSQCEGSLSVVKQIVPEGNRGEDVTGAEPAGPGWTFGAVSTTPGVVVEPASETTTDDGTGSVTFRPRYEGATSGSVNITETQHTGYGLVTQGGANAVCVDRVTGGSLPVTNTGTDGFTVDVASGASVTCMVYDRPESGPPTPEPPHLTLVKMVHGGKARPGDWILEAAGPTDLRGRTGEPAVTRREVEPGTYVLSEHGPRGYRALPWRCTNAEVDGNRVTVRPGADVVCVIVNKRKHKIPPTLRDGRGAPDSDVRDGRDAPDNDVRALPMEQWKAAEGALPSH